MKTLILLHLLIVITYFAAQGQVFPNDSAYWKVEVGSVECVDPYGVSDVCYEQQYFLSGDTTIGDQSYKKVYSSMRYRSNLNTWTYYYNGYFGAIYSDNEANKVYWRPASSFQDTLLYDFNLSVGETLPESYVYDPEVAGIIQIDDIDTSTINGQSIVRYHMDNAGFGLEYILQGIGSTLGLLEPITPFFEHHFTLLCFQNYETSLTYPENGDCDVFTDISSYSAEENNISIYPNPANGILNIDNASVSHIQIFSITGLLISESEIKTDHFELKLKGVPEGMYFLRFEKDLEIKALKIIVQH
jgi:hypothetical protein